MSFRPGTVLLCLFIFIKGCASPNTRVDRLAEKFGFERYVIQGTEFSHLVYRKQGVSSGRTWHVYIEHDGLPWKSSYRISDDPTPRRPLALRLMAIDPAPGIYLGRPCYFGISSPVCSREIWTSARYSERVVASMAKALQDSLPAGPVQIVLIGHSGGGTLAWLLAARLPNVRAVFTIAGNLDVAAWAEHHNYSPLPQSLDPALSQELPSTVRQIHYTGGKDTRVPANLTHKFASAHPDATFIHYPDFGHECCWEAEWVDILNSMKIDSGE